MRPGPVAAGAVLLAALVACAGPREAADPALAFGHRAEDPDRPVLAPEPPGPDEPDFFVYPAVVTAVQPRTGPTLPDGRRPVELVLEGALPDACFTLHDAREERFGHHLHVTLEVRRPKGALCPTVVRPFRVYLPLAEPLPVGPYMLRVNGAARPFEVLPERPRR